MALNNTVAGQWIESNWPNKFDRKVIPDHPDTIGLKGTYIFDLCQNIKTGEVFVWNIKTEQYEEDPNFVGYFANITELSALMPLSVDQFCIAIDDFEYIDIPFNVGKILTATSNISSVDSIIGNASLSFADGVWDPIGSGSGSGIYTNENPVPTTLGGISSGTTFTEVPVTTVLDMLLYPYQTPSFSSFSISGLSPTTVEVGYSFPELSRDFAWSFSNPSNVAPDTTDILDVTNGTTLVSNVNASPQNLLVPELVKNTSGTHTFKVQAENTQGGTLSRNYNISWQWAMFYGESDSTSITGADVNNLRVKTLATSKSGTFNLNAGGYKYFAWPTDFGSTATFKDVSTNLDVAMEPSYQVSVTNVNGVSKNYYVFRTTNVLGGSISIRVS